MLTQRLGSDTQKDSRFLNEFIKAFKETPGSCGTGLVYENSPVEKMVGHNGTVADYCFCWNGKHFREYTYSYIKEYVKRIKLYCVWVDDDLRASNHNPVEYGCFCDECI